MTSFPTKSNLSDETRKGIDTRLMLVRSRYNSAQADYQSNPSPETKSAFLAAEAEFMQLRADMMDAALKHAYGEA